VLIGGIKHTLRIVRLLENSILIFLLAAMIVVAVGQIVSRNVFGIGISWGDPLLRILVLWVGLAGAIVATRENHHISVNALARLLPRRLQVVNHILMNLFASAVSGLIAYHSARFVYFELEAHTVAFAGVPAWVCQLIMPIAFSAMAVRFLALSVHHTNRALAAGNT